MTEVEDWKRQFYILALHVVTAQTALACSNEAAANEALENAISRISALDPLILPETESSLVVK